MAEISTSGLEELLSDMEAIAEIPDAVILEMLAAEAGVIAPAQAAEAREVTQPTLENGGEYHFR